MSIRMVEKKKQPPRIYVDNSASTSVDGRVLEAMQPYWQVCIGNAGSIHKEGRDAKKAIEDARVMLAKAVHTIPENIIFTSCGTESNNLAIFGVIRALRKKGKKAEELHVITSKVEHNSVYDCFQVLESEGVRVTYVSADSQGRVNIRELEDALSPDTVLVSSLYVNNEIGTIEHIHDIARAVRNARKRNMGAYPLLHTDASQAFTWLSVDVGKLGVDLLTLDSQKIYGPKGAGCLFARNKDLLEPIFYGGGQEFGLRPGTPPTPLIVGFAKAIALVEEERSSYVKTVEALRDMLLAYVLEKVPTTKVHGALGEGERIAGNISFSFLHIDGEQLVIELDMKGVAASTRSACLSHESHESRVIQALCKEEEDERSTLRITLSRFVTEDEVQKVAGILVDSVLWLQSTKH